VRPSAGCTDLSSGTGADRNGEAHASRSERDGGAINKAVAEEVNVPLEGDAGRYPVIGIGFNANIRRPVYDSYRDCRPKWLAKLLKLFGDRLH